MSKEAFDKLLGQLDSEDRENIYAMAAAYGLTFDDPSWIPFALTQATLVTLQEEIEQAASAIEEAADHALRKINTKAQTVGESTNRTGSASPCTDAHRSIAAGTGNKYRRKISGDTCRTERQASAIADQ